MGAELPDELDVIEPAAVETAFGGRAVALRPLTVGQLPAFARALRPMMGVLQRLDLDALDAAAVIDLLADHGEHLLQALSVATGISRAELDRADPASVIGLVAPVIKVNADFFGRSLRQVRPQALAEVPGHGPTPSRH